MIFTGMKIIQDGRLMSKWINIYVVLLFITITLIFFNRYVSLVFSGLLLLDTFYILYLSNKNKTTSIVHTTMFIISMVFFISLSLDLL